MTVRVVCMLFILLVYGLVPVNHENAVFFRETAWLQTLQRPDGAIVDYATNPSRATPYFANVAAMALTLDPEKRMTVERYISWYFDHINHPDKFGMDGTIYDYQITKQGEEQSCNDYDSADSYAATFLSLLRWYYENGGDKQILLQHRHDIDTIGEVLLKLLDSDHLSFSKPNYHVKFLMDNCEVYQGLNDLAYLYRNMFHDGSFANRYQFQSNQVRYAILSTFKKNQEFYTNINGAKKQSVNWHVWYPDSTSELYPIVFGVVSPNDPIAKHIYAKFNQFHPDWVQLKSGDRFPWAIVGYAALQMKDLPRAKIYYRQVQIMYLDENHFWPWNSEDAGWFIRINEQLASPWDLFIRKIPYAHWLTNVL